MVYSASKTLAATAIGLAIGEGLLTVDDRLGDLLVQNTVGSFLDHSPVAEITVHQLLSMSTGHTEDTLPALAAVPPGQWASRLLELAPQRPPGSRHVYNNGASWALGELIRRRTGQDLLDYLRPRLLQPLGIEATWDTDALGRCLGWSGVHLTTMALARIGELYRQDGVWQGRRLLPEGWVARATARHIPTVEPNPDWNHGYGYQLWRGREGYRLDGAYGQFSLVLPERGLVIAITSAQSGTQLLLDLVWDALLPELASAGLPGDPSSGSGIAGERWPGLTKPRLPVPLDSGFGSRWAASGPIPPLPALAPAEEQQHLPSLADPSVRRVDGEFLIDLTAEGRPVHLSATPGRWTRQPMRLGAVEVPVAVATGADEHGADLRVVFTDTPHTLLLRVGADGIAGQAWKVSPLHAGSLTELCAR